MTLIETIEQSDQERLTEIKTVKQASVYNSHGIVFCRHYDTIIFAYDQKNKVCEIRKDCSMTSNRQLRYMLDFYNLDWDDCKNINKGSKWAFSTGL